MKTYIPGETKVQRKARKNLTKHKIQPAVVLDTAPSITVSKSSTTQKIAFVNSNPLGVSHLPVDEFLLLGACVYIHERISSEYKEAKPTSKLHGILSSIVKVILFCDIIKSLKFISFLFNNFFNGITFV